MHPTYHQEKIDFKHLNHQLIPKIPAFLHLFLPRGILEGAEYVALNPTRHDRHLGSFRINTRTGKWADFATGDKGGDFISLWAYLRSINQIEAARELQVLVHNV